MLLYKQTRNTLKIFTAISKQGDKSILRQVFPAGVVYMNKSQRLWDWICRNDCLNEIINNVYIYIVAVATN